LILSPFLLLAWIMGIYDALKVGLDPLKKDPLRKRFKYAINRIRVKGLARGVVPQLKVTLMWVLLLVLSLLISYLNPAIKLDFH
jgi:hypothetical protein